MIDFHSHFLPAVDDGSSNIEKSIEYMEKLNNLGFDEFVITPHIYINLYDNRKDNILKEFNNFKDKIQSYFGEKIKIYPSSEVYLSEDSIELILNDQVVTVNNNGKYVLFEVDFTFLPINLESMINRIRKKGINLIWAHPERNSEVIKNPEILEKYIAHDVLMQINLGSFAGQFGQAVEQTAKRLLKMNMVHLIGSDCHCTTKRKFVYREAINFLKEHARPNFLKYILYQNAKNILDNKIVYPFPYEIEKKSIFNKIRKFFKID